MEVRGTMVKQREKVRFSSMGEVNLRTNPNPMLYEGAPTSTGGITYAARLCDALAIPLNLLDPRSRY